jgi:hypothetical protein
MAMPFLLIARNSLTLQSSDASTVTVRLCAGRVMSHVFPYSLPLLIIEVVGGLTQLEGSSGALRAASRFAPTGVSSAPKSEALACDWAAKSRLSELEPPPMLLRGILK